MESLLNKVKKHCLKVLDEGRCHHLQFHNVQHTNDVVKSIRRNAVYQGLTDEEIEPLLIAAYFHDTGVRYIYKGHEYVSAANAKKFLEEVNYPRDKTRVVINCILATQMPQSPKNNFEEMICDADLSHLGKQNYFEKNELLREEWREFMKLEFTDTEWRKLTIDFLMEHRYFTAYGKDKLQAKKRGNILKCMSPEFL